MYITTSGTRSAILPLFMGCGCGGTVCHWCVCHPLQVGEAAERLRGTQSQAAQSTGAVQEGLNISHS